MLIVAAGLMLGGFLSAQTASKAPRKSASPSAHADTARPKAAVEWREECSKAGGFCIQVPKDWKSLGAVFDQAGFVVAEPDTKKPEQDWNQITAAAIDMPETAGQERPSTGQIIDMILGSPANGIHTQTIERAKLMVAGMPTETLKIRLQSADATVDDIEYVALLDDGETIYSVALGCAPSDAARLQTIFERSLHSWKAIEPQPQPAQPTEHPKL